MPHIPKTIIMFYELYNIPIRYRKIMTEFIVNNRLLRRTFNKMLMYIKIQRLDQEFSNWEILK